MTRPFHVGRQLAGGFTTAALLGALALTGSFTNADAQGNEGRALEVFEAAQQAPPEHAELERATQQLPAAPARTRRGVDELIGQIARQRGGKERLEQARKGGRPDQPPPRTSATQRVAEWFAWFPDVIASAHAAGDLSVTLTPQVNSTGAHGGLRSAGESDELYASAILRGAYVNFAAPSNFYVAAFANQSKWDDNTTSRTQRPYVSLATSVPRDGYYIINTRAHGPAGIQLRRYQYPNYPVVRTFDVSGTADRPALVYLTKGNHYFYWVSPSYFYLYSTSVNSYP